MKASDLKRGATKANADADAAAHANNLPTQEEVYKAAHRTAWGLIARGIGAYTIYNISKGISNNFRRAMGGSIEELSGGRPSNPTGVDEKK